MALLLEKQPNSDARAFTSLWGMGFENSVFM